jgi:hypothetical protein
MKAFVALMLFALPAFAVASDPIRNWAAAPTWTPPAAHATGRGALVGAPPVPFVPVTPCRIIDTRGGSGFPAGYGPPSLGAGEQRTFVITGQCGLPADAQAVSFNFSVWAPTTRGDLRVFPAGGAAPVVSTLNWETGILALANAASVPLGTGGAITLLNDGGPVDVFVDVNGFYGPTPADPTEFFSLNVNSLGFTMRLSNSSTTCAGTCGVLQTVASGSAIEGETFSTDPGEAGVIGTGHSVIGVKGSSTGRVGVLGAVGVGAISSDAFGAFVPIGVSGVSTSGGIGVRGESNGGEAIVGIVSSNTANDFVQAVVGAAFGPGLQDGVLGEIGTSSSASSAGVVGNGADVSTYGVLSNGTLGALGPKAFVEPHPYEAGKVIRYVALEGSEAGTYFRGTGRTRNGEAVITVPDDFRWVTDESGLTVHLTAVGGPGQIWVQSRSLDRIVVGSRGDVSFDFIVHGVRKAFKDWQVVSEGAEFTPRSANKRMPPYLSEEAKRRLIQNGTYNPDGTVNMATAERMGWAQGWREAEARASVVREAAPAEPRKR